MVRLAISGPPTDAIFAFGRQIGATDYVGAAASAAGDRAYLGYQELLLARKRVEDAGLHWEVAGIPEEWSHLIKLGLPGREQQITSWCKSIDNLGAVGVPVICCFFSLRSGSGNYGLRTSCTTSGRGGAKVTSFDLDDIRGARQDFWDPPVPSSLEIGEQEVWDNLEYFLERVVPVAEQAGVTLALHPDDPPASPIAGIARVLTSHAALKRAVEMVPSDANRLTFCHGTISAMSADVYEAIQYFATAGKIAHLHFRTVSGTVPSFSETFVDEGDPDMVQAMSAYVDRGYDGTIVEDHVPEMLESTDGRQDFARGFALGYIKAALQAAQTPKRAGG